MGGQEVARHPVTGEVLSIEDFRDVMGGVHTSDGAVDALAASDLQEDVAAQADALALYASRNEGLPSGDGGGLGDGEEDSASREDGMDVDDKGETSQY